MYGTELIQTYFTSHTDRAFDNKFREGAGFFSSRNCIYRYEKFDADKVRLYFRDRMEFRNQAIVENGQRVGHVRLATPHTITTREGTIICTGVRLLTDKKLVRTWKMKDVKIRRAFFSGQLIIRIDNNNLNLKIECDTIEPESFSEEIINNIPEPLRRTSVSFRQPRANSTDYYWTCDACDGDSDTGCLMSDPDKCARK